MVLVVASKVEANPSVKRYVEEVAQVAVVFVATYSAKPQLRGAIEAQTQQRGSRLGTVKEQPILFHSAFMSYSHKDKALANRLYDALQGRGIRSWLDEHQVLPGDKIPASVDQGIRLWDKVLLCCSKDSLKSWWVKNEIELAIQKEQRLYDKEMGREVLALIPLDLDGYLRNGDWNSGWQGQIIERAAPDFTNWEYDNAKFERQLERVVKALRADAGARGVVPPSRL